jgi:PST family polysaccharide transporter
MALALAGFVRILSDAALGAALVQRRTIGEEDRSTAFWLNVLLGAALTVLGIALAGTVADFFGEERVGPLFAVFSLSFLVGGLTATQSALLTRAMNFRAMELARFAGVLAGAGTAVVVAAEGHGPWALVGQQLAAAVVASAGLWVASPWRPRLVFSTARMRELAGFSVPLFLTKVLFAGHRSIDNILVGRFLGAPPLGLYAVSYNLVFVPFGRIADPVRLVLFPALSRVQDELDRVAAAWYRGSRAVVAALLPALLGLVVLAPEVLVVVLGERWREAAPVVRALAVAGLLQTVVALNSVVLSALGRVRRLLWLAILTFALSVAGIVAGLPFGIVGVAVGYACASAVIVPIYVAATARTAAVEPLGLLVRLRGAAAAAAGVLAAVAASKAALLAAGAGPTVRLTACVAVGLAAYVVLLRRWARPEWDDLTSVLRSPDGSGRRRASAV